jgi:hypothetical protein
MMDEIWRETHLVGKGAFPNLPHSRQGMTSVVPQPPPDKTESLKLPVHPVISTGLGGGSLFSS